ncbi:MAG: ABC transporter permease [Magnetococcales bacterium]|nr:ABC transporter permease [Magnetococcales bacterium]
MGTIDMTEPERKTILVERVYSSESPLRHPLDFFRLAWRDVVDSRDLAWRLFRRDLQQRYRQSVFGFLWLLIPPIVTTAIFVFLNEKSILNLGATEIPYPVYVMLGTLLWQIFTESVMAPMTLFESCVPIMIKINMPREAPILAAVGQVLFVSVLQLMIAFAAMLYFGVAWHWTVALAPFVILVLILLGATVGLFLVPIGALYKDVKEGITIFLRLAFFLTPIVYPPPQSWPYSMIVNVNPVTPILQAARDCLARGTLADPGGLLWLTGGIVVVFFLALIYYRLAIPVILERLGA